MGAWLTTCDARLRSASCASVDALRGRRACFSICHRRARPPSAPRCHVSRPTCIWGTHDFGCLAVSAADCFCRFLSFSVVFSQCPVVRCRFQSVSCRFQSVSCRFHKRTRELRLFWPNVLIFCLKMTEIVKSKRRTDRSWYSGRVSCCWLLLLNTLFFRLQPDKL